MSAIIVVAEDNAVVKALTMAMIVMGDVAMTTMTGTSSMTMSGF